MNEARTLESPPGSGPHDHEIGPHGVVAVATALDRVVVRGVEGGTARLVEPAGTDLLTEAAAGRFAVRTPDARAWPAAGDGRGWLGAVLAFGLGHTARTIELEVPHGCGVEVRTASGAVTLIGIDGSATVDSASGDVRLEGAGGETRITTASGRVSLSAPGRLAAAVRTASGDVDVTAGRFAGLALSTMSGRVTIAGSLEPQLDGTVSTASGSVVLAVDGDVTIDVRTVAGRARGTHRAAVSRDRGPGWVLGSGTARLAVSTISGRVDLRERERETAPAGAAAGPAPAAGADAHVNAQGTAPLPDEAAPAPDHTPAAAGAPRPEVDEATLAILRSVERGDINVDEAARRLEGGQHGSDGDD